MGKVHPRICSRHQCALLILFQIFLPKTPASLLSALMERFSRALVKCEPVLGFTASKLEHIKNFILLPFLKDRKGSVVGVNLKMWRNTPKFVTKI